MTRNSELHFGFAHRGAEEALGLGWVRDKCVFIGCVFSPGAWVDSIGRRAHTRQYTGDRSLQTTRTAPYVCICSDTHETKGSQLRHSSVPEHTSSCGDSSSGPHRILPWLTATAFKTKWYLSAFWSLYTPFQSPTFLPGNVCIALSLFPLKSRTSTLLFLTLTHPTQSHTGFLPNGNASNNKVSKKVSSGEW